MNEDRIRPFPGKTRRFRPLTDEQILWIKDYYSNHTDKELASLAGTTPSTIRDNAKKQVPPLEKDEEWLYYERCKRIGKHFGCSRIAKQKRVTLVVATKLGKPDYLLLCEKAKNERKTKYQFLQEIIRKALHEQ